MKPKHRFTRPCKRCDEIFTPTGRENRICDKCNKSNQRTKNKEKLKLKYFAKKEQLNKLRDNATLENYKILSEAQKLGKQIWNSHFTLIKLAEDMDMPYTTVHRCMSLSRASKSAWKLVKEGKLTAFKLAMICSLKNKKYQDKIIKIVVKDNLSTYQIKTLTIKQIEDVNVERHRLAVENGYSRERSAYYSFNNWINRGKLFLTMDIDKLPKDKIPVIKEELEKLNRKIKLYLGKD